MGVWANEMRGTGNKNQVRNLIKHGADGSDFPDPVHCPGIDRLALFPSVRREVAGRR